MHSSKKENKYFTDILLKIIFNLLHLGFIFELLIIIYLFKS